MESLKQELQELWIKSLANNLNFDRKYIQENFSLLTQRSEKQAERLKFYQVFDRFINEQRTERSWKAGTLKNFKTFKKNLKRFSKDTGFFMDFDSLDKSFLTAFIDWHKEKKIFNPHTLKNIKFLTWFLEWSTASGLNKNVNYKTWKPNLPAPGPDDNNFALTDQELAKLESWQPDSPENDKIRDVFLMSCYTSLRYEDLKKLRKEDVINGHIILKAEKTRKTTKIPIILEARAIIEKYASEPGDRLLPMVVNQVFNRGIKTVCHLAGITEPDRYVNYIGEKPTTIKGPKWQFISSKDARKTFVSVCFNHGIPSEVTASITGHTSERMAVIYRKISDEKKVMEMQKFSKKKIS